MIGIKYYESAAPVAAPPSPPFRIERRHAPSWQDDAEDGMNELRHEAHVGLLSEWAQGRRESAYDVSDE